MRCEHVYPACRAMSVMLLMIAAVIIATAVSSCTSTKYVPVELVRVDSIYLTIHHRDSIYLRDSVTIRQAGDTVYVDKVRYQYRDRLVRDTAYLYRDREVQVPYPVEKPLGWWDRTSMLAGRTLIPIVFLIIVLTAVRAWLARRRGGAR